MLHMEYVRRVVCAEVMFHVGQQPRRFIAGRLHDLTVQPRQGLLHERLPRVLSTGVGRLLQNNGVALGCRCHQAQSAGTRFILGHRDGFGGHGWCQPCAVLLAIPHHCCLHLAVDLLLDARGGSNKALEACEFAQPTHQAHAPGPHCRAHQMSPENETMQEGQPRRAVKKHHDGGMFVEALVVGPPGLQGTAGNLKGLGGLTQGEPLGVQIKRLIEECSTWGARPAWGALIIAVCFGLDDGAHSDLLLHPLPVCCPG
jgi:hypothetical protein